jgi:uncharacterized repeat protein (TIGR03803 family)
MPIATYTATLISRIRRCGSIILLGWVSALATTVLTPLPVQAQTYKVLFSFKNKRTGKTPSSGLLLRSNGDLYGATAYPVRGGTIFRLQADGRESVLYRFCSVEGNGELCDDGDEPSGVVRDAAGNLYGTTSRGGDWGVGTVFKLAPGPAGSTETVLHSFCSLHCADGETPYSGLIRDPQGNLYGTTALGGKFKKGVVFELTPNADGTWTENVLHTFCSKRGCPDGKTPVTGVVRDDAGTLYGTTLFGGAYSEGTVFKLALQANGVWKETVLYSFSDSADGGRPGEPLVRTKSGTLYGATDEGGDPMCSCGVIFKLTEADGAWTENVLHTFSTGPEGSGPYGGVVADAAGNLYGTTYMGGGQGVGTVYKLDTDGGVTVLHTFCNLTNCADGKNSLGGLLRDSSGDLYGTAQFGGAYGYGVVFKIAPQ